MKIHKQRWWKNTLSLKRCNLILICHRWVWFSHVFVIALTGRGKGSFKKYVTRKMAFSDTPLHHVNLICIYIIAYRITLEEAEKVGDCFNLCAYSLLHVETQAITSYVGRIVIIWLYQKHRQPFGSFSCCCSLYRGEN